MQREVTREVSPASQSVEGRIVGLERTVFDRANECRRIAAALATALWLCMGSVVQAQAPITSQSMVAAVKAGDDARLRALLKAGADPNVRDADGMTPLVCTAFKGSLDRTAILLDGGADPNGQDILGMTPLHAAAFEGRLEIIRLLLARGASAMARDKWGHDPLFYALQNKQLQAADLLRSAQVAKPARATGAPSKSLEQVAKGTAPPPPPVSPPVATRRYTDETLGSGGLPVNPVNPADECCPPQDSYRPPIQSSQPTMTLSQIEADRRAEGLRNRIRQLNLDKEPFMARSRDLQQACDQAMYASQGRGGPATPVLVDPTDSRNQAIVSGRGGSNDQPEACRELWAVRSELNRIESEIGALQNEIYTLQYNRR